MVFQEEAIRFSPYGATAAVDKVTSVE